jgi:predicted acyl esterase
MYAHPRTAPANSVKQSAKQRVTFKRSHKQPSLLAGAVASALLLFTLAQLPATAHAQVANSGGPAAPQPPRISELYTKYEYRIPMRDGVKLFTVVYVPKDSSRNYPFLMERTPYAVGVYGRDRANYGVDFIDSQLGPSEDFAKAGYIFVRQDVRGRQMSEGLWTEMQPHKPSKKSSAETDASSDTYDTVEWLLKHVRGNNGRVGIWGNSYPGFYAAAGIIDGHPAIKAASPQAPVTDMYMNDDAYHNGALMLAATYGFFTFFKAQANPVLPERYQPFEYGSTSGYDYFLTLGPLAAIAPTLPEASRGFFQEMIDHPTRDAYWLARDISQHMKQVRAAVLTVGGWYDSEDPQGPLSTFAAIDRFNPGIANNHLVMGPWSHGGWLDRPGERMGAVRFDAATAEHYRKQILFPFFEKHLRADEAKPVKAGAAAGVTAGAAAGAAPGAPTAALTAATPAAQPRALAKATVFETGTNVWRHYETWPPRPAQPRTLYFQPGGGLAFQAPPAAATADLAYDEYRSDPARPVPFMAQTSTGVPQEYVVADQRFAATRPDVLVYQTAALEEDLTVVGPLNPRLFVSTTGTDADWVVKLIDVYPDRYPDPPAPAGAAGSSPRGDRAGDVNTPGLVLGGYQQLVRGEPMRGKYRKGFEQPEPFVPGEVAAVNFRMPDVAHTFRRGHRIMVQVQSSWFPLVDRNPQTFVDIGKATAADFRAATQRVFRAGTQASGIQLLVMPTQ